MPLLMTSSALESPLGDRSRIVPVSSKRKPGFTTPSDAENETSLILFALPGSLFRTSELRVGWRNQTNIPQRLKPRSSQTICGTTKVVPFQNRFRHENVHAAVHPP